MRSSGVETWCGACVCVCVSTCQAFTTDQLHLSSFGVFASETTSCPGLDTMLMRSTQVTGESSTAGSWQIPTQTLTDLWQHWRQRTSKHLARLPAEGRLQTHTQTRGRWKHCWHHSTNTAHISVTREDRDSHSLVAHLSTFQGKYSLHTQTHTNCTPSSCLSSLLFKKNPTHFNKQSQISKSKAVQPLPKKLFSKWRFNLVNI